LEKEIRFRKRAAYISLSVGIGMFIAKMGAYLITGSAAIFSDAAESVVHILATGMALYSIILSSKPEDDSHLYGHGNIEFFSAGIEGLLILAAAVYIIYQSVTDIILGHELKKLDIGIIIIALAGGINLLLGSYLVKIGKKTSSLTLVADGKHVLTDAYTSIGVMVGITLVFITGLNLLDPLFAIAVALNILFTGYKLIRESIGGLMNETNEELMRQIAAHLSSIKKDYWIDIHELRFWQSGERIFLDFHLILPHYFTIRQTHKEENDIEASLKEKFPAMQIKIHFDYCVPELCVYCDLSSCEVRTRAREIKFEWNKEKMKGKPVYISKSILKS
jgi:cation diffusion facilitator family transporter